MIVPTVHQLVKIVKFWIHIVQNVLIIIIFIILTA